MNEAQENWRDKGWELVCGFLDSDELVALRQESERLLAQPELFEDRGAVVNSTSRRDRLDPVIDISPRFAALAGDPRLMEEVGRALGGKAQLFKDKFIAKPPGAPGYGAHQDGAYWPGLGIDPDRFLTAVLFLDDCRSDQGPIECVRGPHGALLTEAGKVADPEDATLGTFVPVEASAGDLLLLHAFTPHRSGPNRSGSMRRALFFTFGADDRPDLYGAYQSARTRA